ncbi:MAG: alpha/beta fold hydrolase [Brevirhabdus sp.]
MTWTRLGRTLVSATLLLSVIALGGAGLVGLRAGAREARAAELTPPGALFVEVEGLRIHAEIRGEGPDIVLIHGSSGNLRDFSFDLARRLERDFRVISFDRPGLGWSDPLPVGREGIDDQARVLQRAAAKLGAERPLVLGQSYGGAVALAWAATLPDSLSGLLLVAAPALPWQGGLDRYYRITSSGWGRSLAVPAISAFVGAERVTTALDEVFAPQPVPDGYLDHLGLDLTLSRGPIRANARQRARLKQDIIRLSPHWGAVAVPTEILHGDQDRTVSPMIHALPLAEMIEGADLRILKGIGHMPHHGAPAAEITAAARRVAARAGLHPPP